MKKLIGRVFCALLFLLVAKPALFGQVYTGSLYRSRVADSTTVSVPAGYGAWYYNAQAGEVRMKDAAGWFNPRGITSVPWGSITGVLSNQTDLQSALDGKQVTLVSGTNIKTINGTSLLGSGNIVINSAVWGNITGTLSAQTDLQAALDGKWALTGTSTLTGNTTITGTTRSLSFNTNSFTANENGGGTFINSRGGGTFIQSETGGIFIQSNVGFTGGGINIGRSINNAGGINIQDRNFLNFTSRDASGTSRYNLLLDGINGDAIFTDGTASPKGLRYNATGYVTQTHSLTDKEYVDGAITAGTAGAALTKVDDTNVTLTLGGTPATSLLRATSLTLGWTGTLSIARGGTGSSTQNFVDISSAQTGIAGNKSWTGQHLFGSSGLAASFGSSASLTPIFTETVLTRVDQNAQTFIAINNATNGTAAASGYVASAGAASFTTSFTLGIAAAANTTTNLGAGGNAYFSASTGIQIGTTNSNPVRFYTNNTLQAQILSTGELLYGPNATTLFGGELVQYRKDQNAGTYFVVNNATNNTQSNSQIIVSAGAANLSTAISMISLAPTFTSSGAAQAGKGLLQSSNTNGLNISTSINTPLQFWTNNTLRGQITGGGALLFGASATAAIGSEVALIRRDANDNNTFMSIVNATNNTAAASGITLWTGAATATNSGALFTFAPSFTNSGLLQASKVALYSTGNYGVNIGTISTQDLQLFTNSTRVALLPSGGGLAVGPNSLSADAILEGQSTTKGFRPPLMTSTQRNAISSPTDGLIVANSTGHTIDWYNGSSWQSFGVGTIIGSTGSTDNRALRSDGTGGLTVQNSGLVINDVSGNQLIVTPASANPSVELALYGGDALSGNNNGGDLVIDGGNGTGTGVNGKVRIPDTAGTGTRMVVADASGYISTQTIPSTGVGGSVGSTDNAVLRADVGTGIIQGSEFTVDDAGNPTFGISTSSGSKVVLFTGSATDIDVGFGTKGAGSFSFSHVGSGSLFKIGKTGSATNSTDITIHTTLQTTGTAAAGFGAAEIKLLENASGSVVNATQEDHTWTDATNGSEDSKITFKTRTAGASLAEVFNITGLAATFSEPVILKSYTVGTLPTGTQGMIAYVTDALTPTFGATVVGGGSVVIPVFYNGTNWVSY